MAKASSAAQRTTRALLVAAGRFGWRRLRAQDQMLLAAALTFYAIIAVIPLLVLALWVAGLLLGHDEVRGLMAELAELAPAHLGFSTRLVDLSRSATSIGLVTVAAALIPATTYGEGVLRAFDRLSGSTTSAKGVRGRLRALALLGILPLLVVLGLGAMAILPQVLPGGGEGLGANLLGAYLSFLVAWLAATLLLAVTYTAFSPVPLRGRATWWSAAGTGSFLAGMSLGWVAVLAFGVDVGRAYGGAEDIGALVLLAIYLYLVQLVCLAGYAWALGIAEEGGRTRLP